MDNVLCTQMSEMTENEQMQVNGGGVVAFVYALGFMAGVAPLWVCVGGALVLVGAGMCIYDACQ